MERIDLERARREAKALLRAARAGDAAALARLADARRTAPGEVRLADAQLVVARELGAPSWPALVHRTEIAGRADRLVLEATAGRADRALALLDSDEGDRGAARLDVALVLGDAALVRAALTRDRGLVGRPLGARGWLPLLYVVYSTFLGAEPARTEGLLACARALLGAGADPNASWQDRERGPQSALWGAAGAGEPRMTALLLAAGATVHRTGALARALDREDPETVRLLLEHDPSAGERNMALLHAIEQGRSPEIVRLLAAHGASVRALDADDRRPYSVAVRAGRPDLAAALAELGAQPRVEPVDELIGACFAGDRAAAERLADTDARALQLLRTADAGTLAAAAGDGRRAAVEILLDLGVPVDARGTSGGTALHAAAWTGSGDIVALLLARGADVHKRSPPPEPAAPDPVDYGALGCALAAAYLRHLAAAPAADVRAAGDGLAVITGVRSNTENGVLCSELDGDDGRIADLLAWFAERGAPAQWLVGERVAPPDLGERLVRAGCTAERTAVVMGAALADLALDAPEPEIGIVPVRDEAALARGLAVAEEAGVLDAGDADRARRIAVWSSLGLDAGRPLQHRLAVRDGEVVGYVSAFAHEDAIEGLHLGVLPMHRRQGVGSALARHVLRESRDRGCRFAILGPTPDTIAFWRLLGFALRPWPADRSFYLPL
jgi:ankyrin repeat protein/ribosomal protein S18 acetylase RimI-like enzyme